jgi:hypothetical protein
LFKINGQLGKIFVGFWIYYFFFHEWPLSVTSSWKLFFGLKTGSNKGCSFIDWYQFIFIFYNDQQNSRGGEAAEGAERPLRGLRGP